MVLCVCVDLSCVLVVLQHTTVLPFVIIEMRTTQHRYPSRGWGLAAACCFSLAYILW